MPYTSPNLNDSITLQKILNKNLNNSNSSIPKDNEISPVRTEELIPPRASFRISSNGDRQQQQQQQILRSPGFRPVEKTDSPTLLANVNVSEILKFAKESTQLYSYAQLSQNSLALRLNVLKRSLEILSERPELFITHEDSLTSPFINENNNNINNNNNHSRASSKNISIQSNASSAALSALFRQPQLPQQQSSSVTSSPMTKRPSLFSPTTETPSKQQLDLIDTVSTDVKEIIKLLNNNQVIDFKSQQPQKIVNDLHDLSLLNLNDSKQEVLKIRLLHALATPFVENSGSNATQLTMMERHGTSNISLSTLQFQQQQQQQQTIASNNNKRPFHSISTNKKVTPQAIFTCDLELPWSMKLANDLACLMFGVSRSSLRAFTLMDLIASRSRDFVLSKLMKPIEKTTIFAGEIIAIQRPNNHFAWTSMWGKRKDNMMILIFDQIPCDSGDLVITKCPTGFNVTSFVSNYGNALFGKDMVGKEVTEISKSLASDIENLSRSVDISSLIKKVRYYTVKINNKNVPSAITAVTMDSASEFAMVKLNIHSMPYIAGTIVISSRDHTILSYNSAACKNLFGHGKDLLNSSIDFLIPNFTKLLKYLTFQDHSLHLKNGLVLPEHYFRKLASLVASDFEEDELEFLFLNSDGINGRHRDGNLFKVDVQLRVTSIETFMLWVTYSRSVTKGKKQQQQPLLLLLQKQEQKQQLELEGKQVHFFENPIGNRSVINKGGDDLEVTRELSHQQIDEEIDLPSQLKLLPDNENDIESCGSSTDGLSRNNSLRSPRSSSSLDLKTEKNKQRSIELTPIRNNRVPSLTNSTVSSHSNDSSHQLGKTPPSTTDFKSPDEQQRSIKAIELNGTVEKHYSERELLRLENEAIKEIETKSVLWPKEVGLKRREKKLSDFIIMKNMGEGAYGKVVQAQHKDDPFYKLIIKCIVKERILVDTWVRDRKLGTIPSEIQIMYTLNNNPHPNIMRIVDFFEDTSYYYLETPQHGDPPGIDLFDLIELQTSMSEIECKFIFRQIVQAVYHLHKNGIIHRDIKDENIIIDNQGIIKLIDFGSASYVKSGPFDVFVGTIDYASPEVLNGKPYEGKPQDVWAMGVLLYTLIYKENPFYNVDEIMEGELRIPFVTSDECISLIKRILDRDITKRPSMKDILDDPWLCF